MIPIFEDVRIALLSQYVNSPIFSAIVSNLRDYFDPAANFDDFYDKVWNIDTAEGWGLDLWGRILNVNRVLQIATPGEFFGFDQQAEADTFGYAIFYGFGTATQNFPLSDEAYRVLLLAKAAANITNSSIPAINAILTMLFPAYGNCYVRDNLDMTITYVFGATLSPVDYAIVTQSGALPKPVGVSFDVDQP